MDGMSKHRHDDDCPHDNASPEELLKYLVVLTCDLLDLNETQVRQNHRIISLLQTIAEEDAPPYLASIQLAFKEIPMPGTSVTLTTAGQTAATVITGTGSDGNPWAGPIPAATYADDNSSVATTDASGVVSAVSNGSDNVTATLTTAEGVALTSNPVTAVVDIAAPVTLASIQLAFA